MLILAWVKLGTIRADPRSLLTVFGGSKDFGHPDRATV